MKFKRRASQAGKQHAGDQHAGDQHAGNHLEINTLEINTLEINTLEINTLEIKQSLRMAHSSHRPMGKRLGDESLKKELCERASANVDDQHAALERLHAEFSDTLQRLAWAILRDWQLSADAVQEAFALLAQKFDEIPKENQPGWLIKTVQFQSKNLRRKQQRTAVNSDLVQAQIQAQPVGPAAHTMDLERVKQAVLELPEPQKEVLMKRLVDDQTFAEIAADLRIPLGTVLSRMRLCASKIKNKNAR